MSNTLEIKLIGELELSNGGGLVPLPASRKTRALLGYLVLAQGEHLRSRLCDLLWDGPADPRAALRWSLSKLRAVVDGDTPRIRADRERVEFNSGNVAVDLFDVRAALAGGFAALDTLHLEALANRFRGEVLEGLELHDCFPFAQWLASEREKVRNLHTQLLATLTARYDDEPDRALAHARAWVGREPLDEGGHAKLVELLGRLGRGDEARRAAELCRKLFEHELGRPPGGTLGAALQSLREAPIVEVASSPTPPPTTTPTVRDVGLFGRAEECVALEHFLDRRGEDRRGVLWIAGEPGIGKTRLLADLLERARQRGAETLYGKAYEAEAARPLAIWTEILGEGAVAEETGGRARLFEAVRERLRAADRGQGLVIALDDLQWIDEVSAALVSWLAREPGNGITLTAAVRPGEVEDNPAARRLQRALTREELLEPLPLSPLEQPDALALVRSINPGIDAARTLELSGGNPLFAIEMARTGEPGTKRRLRNYIADRLDRLGDEQRELLRVGAAIGRRFSLELAAEVTGLRSGELLRAAESLEAGGFVRPEGRDEYDFAHDLMRRAAYAELSDPARRLLHRRIARLLSTDPRANDELAPELARQATLADEHELAARACVAAGKRCLRLFAREDATKYALRGLRHTPFLEAADERRLQAELLAIEVHAGLGRRNRDHLYDELVKLAESASSRGEHETARNALYLLSVLDEESGDFCRAEARTLAAVEEGRDANPGTVARALANTGRCLAQLERELTRAERFLHEAAARKELAAVAVDLPWGLGLLAWHRGELGEAERQLERAYEAARERGNHWAAFECLSRLALVDLAANEPTRALEREEALARNARRLGGGSEAALAHALMALARYTLELPTAAEELARALADLRAEDSKGALSTVLNQAAELEMKRGHEARAQKLAEEALAAARAVGRRHQVERAKRILNPGGSEPTPRKKESR